MRQPFCLMKKHTFVEFKGGALYRRAPPSPKTVHRTVLEFTPCGAPIRLGYFARCGERQWGFAPLTPTIPLKRA